jgi:cytoskeletal protein CcmA (bactofilin family)
MFNHGTNPGKARSATDPIATLLGEGTHWQGEINAGQDGLRIEGSVEGTILSEGHVVVAPTGIVKGTIIAKCLTVTGRVEGIFKVEDCLEILGTGWVEGEVELGTLVVDEGGTLQGTCVRKAPVVKPKDVVPFVPRKDDILPDRYAHPASGTHGPAHDPYPAAWGQDRRRY